MIPITVTFKSTETRHFHTHNIEVDKLTLPHVLAAVRKFYPREPRKSFKIISFQEIPTPSTKDTTTNQI